MAALVRAFGRAAHGSSAGCAVWCAASGGDDSEDEEARLEALLKDSEAAAGGALERRWGQCSGSKALLAAVCTGALLSA